MQSILVLQLKRIGDLILTTPALAALRTALPEARITLLVPASCRELLRAMDYIDEPLVFQPRGLNLPIWQRLARGGFDASLDFTATDRTALMSRLARAPRRATFAWARRKTVRAFAYNHFVESAVRDHHTIDHYLDLLSAIDIPRTDTPVTLHLPPAALDEARALAGPGDFALVHPGTARPEKYWLPERWAVVIEHLRRERGLRCILTGSTDPEEQIHLQKIHAQLREPCPDLSGRTDLLTLAALTQCARLVLTVDSAAMHLASAFAIPQVALFGPTNPFHWHPRNPHARVLLAGHPEPLTTFAPRHRPAPMEHITTAAVVDATSASWS